MNVLECIDMPIEVGSDESSVDRVVWALKGRGVPPAGNRPDRLVRGVTPKAILSYARLCVRSGWSIDGVP